MRFLYYTSVLIILLVNFPSSAQEGWFTLNHIAEGNDMNSLHFLNQDLGYTISGEGILFKTTNGGSYWHPQLLSPNSSLNDITFVDNTGFIVGDSGIIYKSENGIDWKEKISGTNSNLNAVFFLSIDTGFVFGNNSTILKTTDIGESWQALNPGYNLTLTDGEFLSSALGFAVSSEGTLIRTTDYGVSWQFMSVSNWPNVLLMSINFPNDSIGYVTGFEYDIGFMVKTTDGGENWGTIYPQVIANIQSSYFISEEIGYIVGTGGYISKTTDAGLNWEPSFLLSSKDLYDVFFLDENFGYVVGEDSTIAKTTNGGESWSLLGSGHTLQLYDIFFLSENVGYSSSSGGDILKTTDSGSSWEPLNSPTDGSLHFIYFTNDSTGFSGGYNGKLLKTTDGGISWYIEDYRPQDVITMWSIEFYDENLGIISANNKIMKTVDGGTNWSVINSQTSSANVTFLDSINLISVGWGGPIFKSTDGGNSWVQKSSGNGKSLIRVKFSNHQIGYAVGWDGTIMKTTNRGESWFSIFSPTNENLWDIEFINETVGYIVGYDGIILYTDDGGLSWSLQISNTDNDLYSVLFTNKKTGYVVGSYGTMLKTLNGGTSGIENLEVEVPVQFTLNQNYPNPFNPSTTISYSIPEFSFVTLIVYDILGKEVATLVEAEKSAGTYTIQLDGTNLTSGVYFYRIQAGKFSDTKKFVLLK